MLSGLAHRSDGARKSWPSAGQDAKHRAIYPESAPGGYRPMSYLSRLILVENTIATSPGAGCKTAFVECMMTNISASARYR
jgi:hypothetical protein